MPGRCGHPEGFRIAASQVRDQVCRKPPRSKPPHCDQRHAHIFSNPTRHLRMDVQDRIADSGGVWYNGVHIKGTPFAIDALAPSRNP
jgi:hypothetical protein